MVFIIYGTTGELIKLIPLIDKLKKKGGCYTVAFVQQEEQLKKFFKLYPHVPQPDLWLVRGYKGEDLSKLYHMPIWLVKALREFGKHKQVIRLQAHHEKKKNIVLVHGDTVTTVFGAYVAKRLGFTLGHIEAGLRSFKIMHPFPEELDRRIVSRYARVHFAPGKKPVENLVRAAVKGDVVDTGMNTVYDSVQFAKNEKAAIEINKLPNKYGIVSIHRNELLVNKKTFIRTLQTLAEYSKKQKMVFLQHPVTLARIKVLGVEHLLEDNFIYVPKLDYFSFMKLLANASFVVTDSGGLQEECTYINTPCLVHRKATERMEGLAEGIVELSYYNDKKLRAFLDKPEKLKLAKPSKIQSPTGVILKYLKDHDYYSSSRTT